MLHKHRVHRVIPLYPPEKIVDTVQTTLSTQRSRNELSKKRQAVSESRQVGKKGTTCIRLQTVSVGAAPDACAVPGRGTWRKSLRVVAGVSCSPAGSAGATATATAAALTQIAEAPVTVPAVSPPLASVAPDPADLLPHHLSREYHKPKYPHWGTDNLLGSSLRPGHSPSFPWGAPHSSVSCLLAGLI